MRERGRMGRGMRDWEREGMRRETGQGDKRLGERGDRSTGRGMRDWQREEEWTGDERLG